MRSAADKGWKIADWYSLRQIFYSRTLLHVLIPITKHLYKADVYATPTQQWGKFPLNIFHQQVFSRFLWFAANQLLINLSKLARSLCDIICLAPNSPFRSFDFLALEIHHEKCEFFQSFALEICLGITERLKSFSKHVVSSFAWRWFEEWKKTLTQRYVLIFSSGRLDWAAKVKSNNCLLEMAIIMM